MFGSNVTNFWPSSFDCYDFNTQRCAHVWSFSRNVSVVFMIGDGSLRSVKIAKIAKIINKTKPLEIQR